MASQGLQYDSDYSKGRLSKFCKLGVAQEFRQLYSHCIMLVVTSTMQFFFITVNIHQKFSEVGMKKGCSRHHLNSSHFQHFLFLCSQTCNVRVKCLALLNVWGRSLGEIKNACKVYGSEALTWQVSVLWMCVTACLNDCAKCLVETCGIVISIGKSNLGLKASIFKPCGRFLV